MENDPLFSGERIYELIPQRPPIVMVDALYRYDREGAETGLDVLTDNIFVEDGKFTAPGLIEHVAQSAAVFAGYRAFVRGLTPETGYIAEVKKFRIFRMPEVGERLYTVLRLLGSAAGMSLFSAEVFSFKGGDNCHDPFPVCDGISGLMSRNDSGKESLPGHGTCVPSASGQMKIFIKEQEDDRIE